MKRNPDGDYAILDITCRHGTFAQFWSIFRRGVVGPFHKVSAKYMALHIAEFRFRHNNRMNPDIFGAVVSEC